MKNITTPKFDNMRKLLEKESRGMKSIVVRMEILEDELSEAYEASKEWESCNILA